MLHASEIIVIVLLLEIVHRLRNGTWGWILSNVRAANLRRRDRVLLLVEGDLRRHKHAIHQPSRRTRCDFLTEAGVTRRATIPVTRSLIWITLLLRRVVQSTPVAVGW